jgi:lysophospholipase L1-like esterase
MMKHLSRSAVFAAIALAVLGSGSTASAVSLGNIMPLGDSITSGYHVAGGYRDPLYTKLHNTGYQFSFVGSASDNSSTILYNAVQAQHEGHGGYSISDIDSNLAAWIGPGKASPDIILLMIGTNDMSSDVSAASVASGQLNTLIGHIYGYRSNVNLYVSSLTVRTTYDPCVRAFNATIPGIVNGYKSGHQIHFVDMYPVLTTGNLESAGVHPNADGYGIMGTTWYNAIHTPEPSCAVLSVIGIAGLSAGAWLNKKRPKHKECESKQTENV